MVSTDWKCPYCNEKSDVNLSEADHIHPVSKGGLTTPQNMVLICKTCNSAKSKKTLRVFAKSAGYDFEAICERLEALGKDV